MKPIKYKTDSSASITVSSTNTNLSDHLRGNAENNVDENASSWLLSVVSGDINLFTNGNVATSSLGTPLTAGQAYQFNGVVASNINMIRTGSVDAVVNIVPAKTVKDFLDTPVQ